MDHILTKCDAPGQNEVWVLAQQLWKHYKRKRGVSGSYHVDDEGLITTGIGPESA